MKLLKVLPLTLCLLALVSQQAVAQENNSNNRFRKNEGAIPNSYIVVFNDDVPARRVAAFASQLSHAHGGTLGYTYQNALRGFSVQMSEAQAVALSRSPQVAYVAEDVLVEGASVQTNPTWALDRIDQRNLPLDAAYNYANNGTGVNVYIIDGGIRYTHQEFSGRAVSAYDYAGGAGIDCNGHGTHVAGIIGGNTYGVAKGAKLWSVRVLDCGNFGTSARILAGIDWLTANHVKPAVANMSFASGTANDPLDLAVRNLIAAGVTTVVAAGNNNGDAGLRSPARVAEAITVAATDQNDTKTSLSNFGAVVDVFAPGAAIVSAHSTGDADFSTRTGTSSAAPFVAGLAARYLGTRPGDAPAAVSRAIMNDATVGKVINAPEGTPNLLAYAGTTLSEDFNDDAVTSFSPTQNPTGTWAYGYKPAGGAFTLFGSASTYFGAGTNTWSRYSYDCCPMVTKNNTGSTYTYVNAPSVLQPAELLNLHPGPSGERSVVRWTAPTTGAHTISGRFQGLDTSGTTSDVLITHNGITIFSGNVTGYGVQLPFSLTRTVVAGDTVEFSVGYGGNGNYSHDSTGLAANINPVDDAPQDNAAPQVDAGLDATVDEGSTFSSTASFTDIDNTDTWTVTVDYGDGTGAQPVTPTQSKTIPLSHVYRDNGTFNVTVTVTDAAGASSSDTALVTVSNVPPWIRLEDTPSTCPAGYRINLHSYGGDPSQADAAAGFMYLWTVTKNGGAYAQNAPGTGRQNDTRYDITPEEEGTYVVTLRVMDKDGGAVTVSRTIIVTKIEPSDDFDDNWRNVARWYLMGTPGVLVSEPNGQLQVQTFSSTPGYDGYYARTGIDMTNQRATVEAVQPVLGDGLDTDFILEDKTNSAQNRLIFKVDGAPGYLRMEERFFNGTTYTSISTQIPYDAVSHRFWRFRHDAVTDTIKWETSPDRIQWTVHHTAPRKFSLTNMQAQLFAGRSTTTTTTAERTAAIFDNYRVGDFQLPSSLLSDNFDDNLLDTALWKVLDPVSPLEVREQNQRLELVHGLYTRHTNGVESVDSYNFWNRTLQVEIPPLVYASASFTLKLNRANYYRTEIGGGSLRWESMGSDTWYRSHVPYNASVHRFHRFRHDAAANTMNIEFSSDGQTWKTLSSSSVGFSLNSVKVVMMGWGWQSGMPSATVFDNLRMEANQ